VGDNDGSESTERSFAHQFADLLIDARRRQGFSCRAMSKRSDGRFSVADLHALECGDTDLSESLIEIVSELYGADPDSIIPERRGLHIGTGVLTVGKAGEAYTAGDTTSLLTTYLRLVRALRHQQRAPYVELRRGDVDHLAQHIARSAEWVVDELSTLMGVTRIQQRTVRELFTGGC
jgi:hypothetical protein